MKLSGIVFVILFDFFFGDVRRPSELLVRVGKILDLNLQRLFERLLVSLVMLFDVVLGKLHLSGEVGDRQLQVMEIDFFLLDTIAFARLRIGHMHGIENHAVQSLNRQLIALFLFELRGHKSIDLENLQIAVFAEAPGDLKLRHFGEMVGEIVITRRQAEAARFLQHEFFLDQCFDQVAFDVETFDHLLSQRAF